VEGGTDDPWPSSPPWQQIDLHHNPQPVWLTLGMAGFSHWSAAVHAVDGHSDAGPEIMWDVACRLHQPPQHLGHRFRWLQGRVASWPEILQLEAFGSAWGEIDERADLLEVRLMVPDRPFPQTVRWKLRFRFPRLP
jgi:hypothetical protein